VRKTFHDGPEAARAAAARREFARLERFAAALADVPGAACPRPLELLADPPGLRMQRAAGVDLFAFLGRHRLGAPLRERLAATMAAAIRAYVESSGEPCPDFNFNNVLYDPATGTLTFVDLGAPQDAVAPAPGLSPYEVTAGDLLGSLIFQSARPRGLRRRGRHAETAALAPAIVRALRGAEGVRLRPAELARATEAAYRRCAFGRSRRRTAWYATAGFVLGRRVRLGPVTVGPPAPWRVGR
jgi:hypothetical protein